MKYRIKQIHDKFYPQFSFFIWWFNHRELIGPPRELMASKIISFDSLEEARSFLDEEYPIKIHSYP